MYLIRQQEIERERWGRDRHMLHVCICVYTYIYIYNFVENIHLLNCIGLKTLLSLNCLSVKGITLGMKRKST